MQIVQKPNLRVALCYGLSELNVMHTKSMSILDTLRIRSTAYIVKSPKGRWSMGVEPHANLARFHLVLSGSAWVEVAPAGDREQLHAGDYVIIPDGKAHTLSSEPGVPPLETDMIPDADFHPRVLDEPDVTSQTQLLCGYFRLSEGVPPILLETMPGLIVQRGSGAETAQQPGKVFELVKDELRLRSALTHTVLNLLSEILCLFAIHSWLQRMIEDDKQLLALFDSRFQAVLDTIHADPTKPWTVETLARISGQSRTVFATHFKSVMGFGPIAYVTQCRVRIAKTLLADSDLSLDRIAERVGYSDTNAFNRAFKREAGSAPGAYRRSSR